MPALSRRWSPQVLAIAGLLVIGLGVLLRLVNDYAVVLLGTLLLGAAIALLNVLIPGLVKAFFPRKVGLMTGLYSVTLSVGAGMGVYWRCRCWSGSATGIIRWRCGRCCRCCAPCSGCPCSGSRAWGGRPIR
ncbi:hypothetical protein MBH78_16145 [Oceanimonas sp. NS1]|nr:hypothetical protein [Oceanimonas sp. NS1]